MSRLLFRQLCVLIVLGAPFFVAAVLLHDKIFSQKKTFSANEMDLIVKLFDVWNSVEDVDGFSDEIMEINGIQVLGFGESIYGTLRWEIVIPGRSDKIMDEVLLSCLALPPNWKTQIGNGAVVMSFVHQSGAFVAVLQNGQIADGDEYVSNSQIRSTAFACQHQLAVSSAKTD